MVSVLAILWIVDKLCGLTMAVGGIMLAFTEFFSTSGEPHMMFIGILYFFVGGNVFLLVGPRFHDI